MARRTATAEVQDGFEVSKRDVPFRIKHPRIPPGSKVTLLGNFEADFFSGNKADAKKGMDTKHVMTLNGDTYEVTVPELAVGETYTYQYNVEPPTGDPFIISRGRDGKEKLSIKVGEEPEKSPSSTHPLKTVQAGLKKRVADIIEATKSHETAQDLEGLFNQLQTEMDMMSIGENQTPMILGVLADVIRESKTIPVAIRNQFPDKKPAPTNITELQMRVEKGSRLFRQQVFNGLKGDKDAREALGISPRASYNPGNPLGSAEKNRLFDRVCSGHDLVSMIPWLGVGLNSVANVPARSPMLDAQRLNLMDQAVARLTPEQKTAFQKAHPDRKAQLLEAGVQGGLFVAAMGGAFPAAALAWVGKGVLEGASGLKIADFVKSPDSKALWNKFKENNFMSRWLMKGESLGDITKQGISSWWQRKTPWGAMKHGAESHFEVPVAGAEPLTEGRNEAFIRKAAEASI